MKMKIKKELDRDNESQKTIKKTRRVYVLIGISVITIITLLFLTFSFAFSLSTSLPRFLYFSSAYCFRLFSSSFLFSSSTSFHLLSLQLFPTNDFLPLTNILPPCLDLQPLTTHSLPLLLSAFSPLFSPSPPTPFRLSLSCRSLLSVGVGFWQSYREPLEALPIRRDKC